jgi:hypothetical protein
LAADVCRPTWPFPAQRGGARWFCGIRPACRGGGWCAPYPVVRLPLLCLMFGVLAVRTAPAILCLTRNTARSVQPAPARRQAPITTAGRMAGGLGSPIGTRTPVVPITTPPTWRTVTVTRSSWWRTGRDEPGRRPAWLAGHVRRPHLALSPHSGWGQVALRDTTSVPSRRLVCGVSGSAPSVALPNVRGARSADGPSALAAILCLTRNTARSV